MTAWRGIDIPRFSGLARCATTDPDAFFPEPGGNARDAKKVCGRCEVQAECLTWALDRGEAWGVWGGLSEQERRRLRTRSRGTRGPEQQPIPHGTPAGACAHYRRGTKPCTECAAAEAAASRKRRAS